VTAWRRRVDEVVAENDEVRDYVSQLERQADEATDEPESQPLTEADLPSGETLAADIERYLREQGP
jgi:hypothetical protein